MHFFSSESEITKWRIELGKSFQSVMAYAAKSIAINNVILNTMKGFQDKPFIIIPNKTKKSLMVILHEDIQNEEILEAYVRALLYAHFFLDKKIVSKCKHFDTLTNILREINKKKSGVVA